VGAGGLPSTIVLSSVGGLAVNVDSFSALSNAAPKTPVEVVDFGDALDCLGEVLVFLGDGVFDCLGDLFELLKDVLEACGECDPDLRVDVDPTAFLGDDAPADFLGEDPPFDFLGDLLADLLGEEDFSSAGKVAAPSLVIEGGIDDFFEFLGDDATGTVALPIEDSLLSPSKLFSFVFACFSAVVDTKKMLSKNDLNDTVPTPFVSNFEYTCRVARDD